MWRALIAVVVGPVWLVLTAWAAAALWYDGPSIRPLAAGLAVALWVVCVALLVLVRPLWLGLLASLALVGGVLLWEHLIPPSNDRDWQAEVARLPRAHLEGQRLTIENLRNFDWHSETEATERWETRSYDLAKLRGVDLFMSYWGSPYIAHTIASWDFGDDGHLAISIETRKEVGESYSAVRGFFREYEIYYVVADERDLVGVRTNQRGEDVYLFHLTHSLDEARNVLLAYVEEIELLAQRPEWYNAFTDNCTTSIRKRTSSVGAARPWDWRLLVNGLLPEAAYENGTFDRSLPFQDFKQRSYISERAKSIGLANDFSERIREGLPGGHAATPG